MLLSPEPEEVVTEVDPEEEEEAEEVPDLIYPPTIEPPKKEI